MRHIASLESFGLSSSRRTDQSSQRGSECPQTPFSSKRFLTDMMTSDSDRSTLVRASIASKGASAFCKGKTFFLDPQGDFPIKHVAKSLKEFGAKVATDISEKGVEYFLTTRSLRNAEYDEFRRSSVRKETKESSKNTVDSRNKLSKRAQLIASNVQNKLVHFPNGGRNVLLQAKALHIKILRFQDIVPLLDDHSRENVSINVNSSSSRLRPMMDGKFKLCDSSRVYLPITKTFSLDYTKVSNNQSKVPPIPSIFKLHKEIQRKKSNEKKKQEGEPGLDQKGYCEPCKKHFLKMNEHIESPRHLENLEKQGGSSSGGKWTAWDYMVTMFQDAQRRFEGPIDPNRGVVEQIQNSDLRSSKSLANNISLWQGS